ncbi:MAG TPA: DoxX family protein [Polyangia bacterium]|nr:DoxX family protein [Polyangia bacterium]
MSTIKNAIERITTLRDKLSFLGPTLARITLGSVFIGTGWGKLNNIASTVEYFASLHIPAPAFQARLAAGTEFFGGILVLLGLGARLASLPMAFTMVVAIATAKWADVDGLTTLLGFEEWSYIVFFIWLALAGPGPLSLDALVKRLWERQHQRGEGAGLPKPLLHPQA